MAGPSTQPRKLLFAAAPILLAGFALRVWSLGDDSLWSDEAFTVFFADLPADRFFPLLLTDGVHTPLYFIIMRAVPTANDLVLRWFSVMTGLISIAVLIVVTGRLVRRPSLGLWAGALLATNPYHIWLSRMARPYALLFLAALLVSYFFLALLNGRRTRLIWLGLLLSSTVAYLTHYFAVALPLAQYLLLAITLRGDKRLFWGWVGVQVISSLPLWIWIYGLVTQEVISFGVAWIPTPSVADLPLTIGNMIAGADGSDAWWAFPGVIAAGIGLVAGIVCAAKAPATRRLALYSAALLFITLLPVFVISLYRPLYVDRYFIVALPGLLWLTMLGWWALPNLSLAQLLAGVVVAVSAVTVIMALTTGANEREDWDEIAKYLAERSEPGDRYLMDTARSLLPFKRYVEGAETAAVYDVYKAQDGILDLSRGRVWVIFPNPNTDVHRQRVGAGFSPFDAENGPLAGWLIAHRDGVIEQHPFNGTTVILVAP